MLEPLAEIEARRLELGILQGELEREAGLAQRYYSSHLLFGRRLPSPAMIARLKLALQRLKLRQACRDERDIAINTLYRALLALFAREIGVEPGPIQNQDPARRATQNPDWMRGAEVRRVAVYLLNVACGFSQTDVARAAGLTKQAVSLACREIEDRRSDDAFDQLVERLTTAVRGEW